MTPNLSTPISKRSKPKYLVRKERLCRRDCRRICLRLRRSRASSKEKWKKFNQKHGLEEQDDSIVEKKLPKRSDRPDQKFSRKRTKIWQSDNFYKPNPKKSYKGMKISKTKTFLNLKTSNMPMHSPLLSKR
ncbi:unnamed protein product [Moneuplotes crassus]|uniref:Uncharacterized protein n=1 Tax=Euplotes crassus TaxID=5936 RepID=A0AAD1XAK5_EUPCR|nr:unnamed protein product [Moneuplotes crassus]